jgi:hypothetical protein
MGAPKKAPFSARPFELRAARYGQWDARLRHVTRFFGAACMTNRVLGYVGSRAGQLLCSEDTCRWLAGTGALLEAENVAIADALYRGRLGGPSLDARIVSIEQGIVEAALQAASGSPHHSRLLAELNAHLNYGCSAARMHFNSGVRWYSRVLSAVRAELAGPLDFAVQGHREAIGLALIARLRREG